MSRLKGVFFLAAFAGFAAVAPTPASAQSGVEVGTLACKLAPTIGLIIGSRQRLSCVFTLANTGRKETYTGAITRLGLDVGISAGGRLVWAVRSKTNLPIGQRSLAGTYVGASADIALGLGVGANALIGGTNRTVALQPLSVEGSVGVNLALGVAGLRLR
jgi:hypothetical protein